MMHELRTEHFRLACMTNKQAYQGDKQKEPKREEIQRNLYKNGIAYKLIPKLPETTSTKP